MKFRAIGIMLTLFCSCSIATRCAEGAVIQGVEFADSFETGDVDLPIRGTGLLRYMVFIKLYVAAFYVEEEVPTEQVLSDVPKRLEIHYFHGITAADFIRSTDLFISKNIPAEEFTQLRARIDRFNALYEDVGKGDRYALTYIPGKGTELALNREVKGTIPGSDFAAAVFSMWLGKNPVDGSLKGQLLGEP